jgi:GMP synthase-like glutamine amidotransferase
VLGGRVVLDVVQYHRDSISELPPDAEVLLTGSGYPIQAFRVGAAAWGVQYHPEVSAEAFARWAGGDPQGPRPEVVADVLAGADRQGRLARVHSEAFTALIRSPADSSPGPASGPRR